MQCIYVILALIIEIAYRSIAESACPEAFRRKCVLGSKVDVVPRSKIAPRTDQGVLATKTIGTGGLTFIVHHGRSLCHDLR